MDTNLLGGDTAPDTNVNPNPAGDLPEQPTQEAAPSITPLPEEGPTGPDLSLPENWMDSLDSDLKEDKSLSNFKDINSLVKSYVHSKRMVGADKILVPNKYDDGTQLREAFTKLGLPESREEYEVKSAKESYDEGLLTEYADKAFEFGVLPKQAQDLYDWFESRQLEGDKAFTEEYNTKVKQEQETLRKEWGPAFEKNIGLANETINYFTEDDPGLNEKIVSQYGADVNFIKFLTKVGDSLKEGRIIKENTQNEFAVTPEQAENSMKAMLADPNHPINVEGHPQRDKALKDYEKYAQIAYGTN